MIKFKINVLLVLMLSFIGASSIAQTAKPNKGTYALTNATIVTVTNGTIENATIVMQDGKITAIGTDITVPAGATAYDCTDHFVYPGMIDGGTTLGLVEVSAVSLTRDADELGEFTPHMQALTAVNPSSVAIPVTRVDGVTTVLTQPTGGLFPGTASLINLVGYTPDQMYAGFQGVILNFPRSGKRGWWDRRSEEEIKKAADKAQKKLNGIWEDLELYAKIKMADESDSEMEYNPEMDALMPIYKGEAPLMIEVNKDKDILAAIKWVKEKEVKNVVFTGVSEGWRVADSLAKAEIPVITGPVISTPTRTSDRYDAAYANAGKMHKAGVKVAIRSDDTENVRNLPFHAGFAATYGMGKEAALKAVTITPAEIFGVADQIGSLEVGKKANLFVSTGDPFETKTQIKYLFIDGYQVPIDSRHIQLYDEFLNRTPGLKK